MKYAVLSDIHAHAWTLYASVDPQGVNTRLRHTLNEWLRAATTLKAVGGSTMFIAGDIFHTRGSMDPETLNPTREVVQEILGMGISIYAIPGNHDLKSQDTNELASAIQNLEQISLEGSQFSVYNQATADRILGRHFGFVPWRWTVDAMLEDLEALAKSGTASEMDVFIHAGIDGVISGMPAGGLTDAKLAAFGFRHVFAGHYHNHVEFPNGVVSVGATTHHNWGDVGTRAGFLIVDGDTGAIAFHDNQVPKFVDLSGLDETDMEIECKGNYVRFRGPAMTQDEVRQLREQFRTWGALGVSIEVPRTVVSARPAATSKGRTLKESLSDYVAGAKSVPAHIDRAALAKRAHEVLDAASTVYEDA